MLLKWTSALVMSAAFAAQAQTTAASAPASPAKKALVAKIIALQEQGIEGLARGIVERPAGQIMQAAGNALQNQVPPDKREAAGKSIEADVRKFVEEATPVVKERALRLGPPTLSPFLEENFSEDELKQLAAWLESPVNKKYQQIAPGMQQALVQKILADVGPLIDPKLKALDQKVRATLGVPAAAAPTGPAAKPPAAAPSTSAAKPKTPAPAASKP